MTEPNFFIIGAPKCGTTALSEYLKAHPDVLFSVPKEPHYFSDDFGPAKRKIQSADSYRRCFGHGTGNEKAVGEGSAFYLYSERAVANIVNTCPEARFIVMLRNPIDAAYSLHANSVVHDVEDVLDFEQAWRMQERRRIGEGLPRLCRWPERHQFGTIYRYGPQIDRLFEFVSRDQVLFIVFDEFISDTARTYRHTLKFLSLPELALQSYPPVNAGRRLRSPALAGFTKRAISMKTALGVSPGLGVIGRLRRLNISDEARTPLAPAFRQELAEYYRADVLRTSELLGRDLSNWLAV